MKSKAKLLDLWEYKSIICAKILLYLFLHTSSAAREWVPDPPPVWAKDVQLGAAKITALDVICGKEHMTVRAEFSAPFQGIISSKGTSGQQNCIYVKPYSSITHATFNVKYDECGTKPDLQGKYYENTIVIQYGTDIIEAWDEAKRLRCEWFEAYEKPATFRPAIPVADLDVIEMNFQGDEIDCWMSIQEGKGPWAREVSRIVAVGQPMTIVIAINDYKNQFDMRVKSCFAHDGVKPAIHLTDEYGCVLRPKMLSPFKKIRDTKGKASLISYAQFLAFKFPDTMDVQIQCTVEVCRHGCADVCEVRTSDHSNNPSMKVSAEIPHSISDQTAVIEDIIPAENERQPIYQDLGAPQSHQPQPHQPQPHQPPQLMFPQINRNEENYNDVKNSEEIPHEEQNPRDNYQAVPHSQPQNFENFNQEGLMEQESLNQPVYKAPAIHINNEDSDPNQRFQIPNLSSLNLKPEDFEVANKLLSNHGLNKGNIDFSNLAATFAHGLQPKDILSLMQKNNVKDLVSKLTNRVEEQQPIAEALHSIAHKSDNSSISLPTDQMNIEDSEPTQSTPFFIENTISAEGEGSLPHVEHKPQLNNNYNRFPFNPNFGDFRQKNDFNKKIAINHNEKLPIFPTQVKAPIAQVLNVPLQPGMPFLQISPNEIVKQQMIGPQKFQIHSNIGKIAFPVPPHPIPGLHPNIPQIIRNVMSSTNNFGPDIYNIKVKSNGGPESQFPFGPRSLRIRRSGNSAPNEIGLKKGFQVVTSVDLAFFPNISTDSAPIYSGRIDYRVNGVCLSMAQLATALSCILWLIVVAFSSCAFMIYKLDKHKKSNLSNN